MGDRLTEEQPRQASATPYGDAFDAFLPQYLAIGMPYEVYWDGETGARKAYREAYRIRMENEQRLSDINNWYMGQYMMHALQAVQLAAVAVPVKKISSDMPKYPDQPFMITAEKEKKEEDRKQQEEDQSKVAMALFQAMITRLNNGIEKRQEKEQAIGIGQ